MKRIAAFILCGIPTFSADSAPELRTWVINTITNVAVAPGVHSVRADDRFVYVTSAGLSLHSFGPLEANQYVAPLGPRTMSFRIPRKPQPAETHLSAPLGVIGVFATGVPIYNPIGTFSYRDQNLWHEDAVAAAATRVSSLLAALTRDADRHSPIIGFALDGYPIYGPFGWDAAGNVRRMKSSYRLRNLAHRSKLPEGTLLTPAQEGPDVSSVFPLGRFAEDYEYAAGSGDLDQFNGRFSKTADYPQGTYAYFLSTTDSGALAWPYLIGPRYFGDAPLDAPARAGLHHALNAAADLWTDRATISAGESVHLTFVFRDPAGGPIRFLEKVHQQPVHLVVVSKDLAEFDHIHPEPIPGDALSADYAFRHGGQYWLYANYTAPGAGPSVARFAITVDGAPRAPVPPRPDDTPKTTDGVTVAFTAPRLTAGQDLPLAFTLTDAATVQPIADLHPWLGAWAHIMIVSGDHQNFIHAHPLENAGTENDPLQHTHTAPVPGPSPSTIRTVTGFRTPGVYKLWFQFERRGKVVTTSWVLRVSAPKRSISKAAVVPAGAPSLRVSSAGFEPPSLFIPAGQPTRIWITRADAQNCAGEIVFPELQIRKRLPPGEPVAIDLPATPAGELHFACGMGMYRGAVVVR
jgi:hypothetical protein